ncbi:hypothetical protein NIES22_16340 [Calothrix brevissima NIES-22]|nr:hypothetical protein NIES22_16340 [Calothrix brevissima NIES-22]
MWQAQHNMNWWCVGGLEARGQGAGGQGGQGGQGRRMTIVETRFIASLPMPNAQCPMPDAQCPMPLTQYPVNEGSDTETCGTGAVVAVFFI